MKKLIIIGAGGHGRETLWTARRAGYQIVGFLDDTPELLGRELLGCSIVGGIKDCDRYLDSQFIVALGSSRSRVKIVEVLKSRDVKFATVIDPDAMVDASVIVGEGTLICAGVICTTNIQIGKHCILNRLATLGHDVKLGDFVSIAPSATVSGNVNIAEIVEIGAGAVIKEKIEIKRESILGMGAVVLKDIPTRQVWVGNPARYLKDA
ncbi:MAG: acetyltransferase [Bdellovibrio sp.]